MAQDMACATMAPDMARATMAPVLPGTLAPWQVPHPTPTLPLSFLMAFPICHVFQLSSNLTAGQGLGGAWIIGQFTFSFTPFYDAINKSVML